MSEIFSTVICLNTNQFSIMNGRRGRCKRRGSGWIMTHTLQLNCVKSAIFCNFVKWKRKRRRRRRRRRKGAHTHSLTHSPTHPLTHSPTHSPRFVTDLSRTSCAIYTNLFLLLPCFLPYALLFICAVSLCANAVSSWQPQFPLFALTHTHAHAYALTHVLSLALSSQLSPECIELCFCTINAFNIHKLHTKSHLT